MEVVDGENECRPPSPPLKKLSSDVKWFDRVVAENKVILAFVSAAARIQRRGANAKQLCLKSESF